MKAYWLFISLLFAGIIQAQVETPKKVEAPSIKFPILIQALNGIPVQATINSFPQKAKLRPLQDLTAKSIKGDQVLCEGEFDYAAERTESGGSYPRGNFQGMSETQRISETRRQFGTAWISIGSTDLIIREPAYFAQFHSEEYFQTVFAQVVRAYFVLHAAERFKDSPQPIYGNVFQNAEDGILVSTRGDEVIFLANYSKSLVDGEAIQALGYREGNYSYVTVLGAKKTIARYNAELPAVILQYLVQTKEELIKKMGLSSDSPLLPLVKVPADFKEEFYKNCASLNSNQSSSPSTSETSKTGFRGMVPDTGEGGWIRGDKGFRDNGFKGLGQ